MAYYNSPYQGMPYNNPYMDRLNAMTMGAQPPGMGQQQAASGQIIRVNGIPGAQAYQMGANAAVALFDANEDYFYIKTTDGAGFASIRRFKFTPCDDQTPAPAGEYVTRSEFEELKGLVLNGQQHIRGAADAAQQTQQPLADDSRV